MSEFDPNAIMNQSSGLFSKNPTHVTEAENAEFQSDIVRAIKNTGVKRMQVHYTYNDVDKKSPPPLAGILKIREMSVEQAKGFCKNLMRTKPNIFQVHIKLGDYPSQRRIENPKTRLLNSQKARFHTEVGEKMGDLLADKSMLVTEIRYVVHNADPGYFNATAEVYGVEADEEYFNDSLFNPTIGFDFIKTS